MKQFLFGKEAYDRSKLGVILISNQIAKQMQKRKIPIFSNTVSPGLVKTEMAIKVQKDIKAIYGDLSGAILDYFINNLAWRPEEGCLSSLYLAVSPDIAREKITGKYFQPIGAQVKPNDLVTEHNSEILWNFSVDLLRQKNMLRTSH